MLNVFNLLTAAHRNVRAKFNQPEINGFLRIYSRPDVAIWFFITNLSQFSLSRWQIEMPFLAVIY